MRSQVSIVKCNGYQRQEVEDAVRKSVELLGGIPEFVKPADKVLIKPNLLSASTPDSGIDTHPEFVRAVIKLVKETGARVILGDSPSVWGEIAEVDNVYEKSGMKQLAEEEKIELVKFRNITIKSGYPVASILDECDCVISLPKFKTHDLMTMTGAVKNLYGFIPGLYKVELHKKALASWEMAKVLADIYSITKPRLSIVDGVIAMEGDGPASGGVLRNLGLVLASSDAVALDSAMATVMGLRPKDILSTKEAAQRGLGNADLKDIDILGEELRDVIVPDYKLPQTSIVNRLPRPFLNVGKSLLHFRPSINKTKCTVCGLCMKACPVSAISIEKGQTKIDNKTCVLCLCCKEVCPQGAISVKKSLVARIAGL